MSRERGNYRQVFLKHNKGIFGTGIYLCGYCFKPVTRSKMEVDHIIPFSKGGTNHHSNLTASCRKCNRSKSDKIDHRVIKGYGTKIGGAVLGIMFAILLGLTYVPLKKMVFAKTSLPVKILGIGIVAFSISAIYIFATSLLGGTTLGSSLLIP